MPGSIPALQGTALALGLDAQQHIPSLWMPQGSAASPEQGSRRGGTAQELRLSPSLCCLLEKKKKGAKNWVSACEILEERPQIPAIFSFAEAAHTLAGACLPLRVRWALRNHTASSQPARKAFNPCCFSAVSPIHTFVWTLMGAKKGLGRSLWPFWL